MIIYLDLDGVLADFDLRVMELLNKRLSQFSDPKIAWDSLMAVAPRNFFASLDKMHDADELVEGVLRLAAEYKCEVGVLTAIPKLATMPLAKVHKKEWVGRHYPMLLSDFNIGPHSQDKHKHCVKHDILIDDSVKNIPQWEAAGGKGILHVSAKRSLIELERYLKKLTINQ